MLFFFQLHEDCRLFPAHYAVLSYISLITTFFFFASVLLNYALFSLIVPKTLFVHVCLYPFQLFCNA